MFSTLDISTSGLIAQRTRLNVTAANLANQNSISDADGNYDPYRRRFAVFAPGAPGGGSGLGVHVASIELSSSPFKPKYEPDSPFADESGFVNYPNIDPVIEQVNLMEAARAYEANIAAIEATKSMMNVALQILA